MLNNLKELPGMTLIEGQKESHSFLCEQKHFENTCFNIQSHYSYIWLIDIVVFHTFAQAQDGDDYYIIKYIFLNTEVHKEFTIQLKLPNGTALKSIAHMWRNASAIEQEIFQLFGIEFSRLYEKRIDWGESNHPMRKDFKALKKEPLVIESRNKYSDTLYLNHELKKNQYEIKVNMKDNLVTQCRVTSGNYYIGLEKLLEQSSIKSSYQILESYYPTKALSWSHLLSSSIEKFQGVNISNRAKGIRMVLLELNRVLNHFQFFTELSIEFSMESLHTNSLEWMKRIQSLLMSYSGNEYGANCIRFGGVTKDISQDWLSRTVNEIAILETSLLYSYKNLIHANSIKDALDFSLVTKTTASSWGVSGPLIRAVGINLDHRKLSPFYFYSDVDFDIPIGVKGSAYDLLLVRVEEVFQSLKIIIQVLDNLPTGQFIHEDANSHIYFKDGSLELDENKYRKSVQNYLEVEDFKSTQMLEGSNGLLSLSIDYSSQKLNRFKINTPSSILKTLYEKVIQGEELNKVKPLWAILDIDLKEAER